MTLIKSRLEISYSPIKFGDGYRTYMAVFGDGSSREYHIYVGNQAKRVFNDATLPDPIKVLVGLINAYNWDDLNSHQGMLGRVHENIIWRFSEHYPPILLDIGWRYLNDYCLVLEKDVLESLRTGLTVSGEAA